MGEGEGMNERWNKCSKVQILFLCAFIYGGAEAAKTAAL
jgi:hypothetical protein